MTTTQENITLALQTSSLLLSDLRAAISSARPGTAELVLMDTFKQACDLSRRIEMVHDAIKEESK